MMSERMYSFLSRFTWCKRGCIYFWIYSDDVRENVFNFE